MQVKIKRVSSTLECGRHTFNVTEIYRSDSEPLDGSFLYGLIYRADPDKAKQIDDIIIADEFRQKGGVVCADIIKTTRMTRGANFAGSIRRCSFGVARNNSRVLNLKNNLILND